MKNVYLILSIVGAIVPYVFFGDFISKEGLDLVRFSKALFVNGAAGGFSSDLLISSLTFWLFLYKTKWKRPIPFIIINLTIGLSCALPLYFYFGERKQAS